MLYVLGTCHTNMNNEIVNFIIIYAAHRIEPKMAVSHSHINVVAEVATAATQRRRRHRCLRTEIISRSNLSNAFIIFAKRARTHVRAYTKKLKS